MASAMNDYGQHEFLTNAKGDTPLKVTSTAFTPGSPAMSVVELNGATVFLATDTMVELHAQLARSLGYID